MAFYLIEMHTEILNQRKHEHLSKYFGICSFKKKISMQ